MMCRTMCSWHANSLQQGWPVVRDSSNTTPRLRSRRHENDAPPPPPDFDRTLPALGVRQPWVELILRGVKTIEVRVVPTNVRGTIYLYASKKPAVGELVRDTERRHGVDMRDLRRGVIVGTVDVVDCRRCTAADAEAACVPADLVRGQYGWVLANPRRLDKPLMPRFLPYGIWFYPFVRRNGVVR